VTYNDLHDSDLDARLIRELSRLPSLAPRSGFSDRVMSRVRLPQPRAVVLFHRARAWASEPRRAMALAGGYAVSATAALAALLPWLFRNSGVIRSASDWMTLQVFGALRDWSLALAGWTVTSGMTDWFKALDLGGGRLALAGGLLTAGYAACALGLHFLLRAPRGTHAPLQA
jgi:hypothetical protein